MERTICTKLVAISLVATVLASCQTAEQRLQETRGGVGMPPDAMLLASQVQARQGSQDACYFTTLFELYGTDLSIEDVIDFYSTRLSQDWKEYSPPWLTEADAYAVFRRDNAFQVSIDEALPEEIDLFGDDTRATAQPHATVYFVTWTYADADAQRNCPVWQTESDDQP